MFLNHLQVIFKCFWHLVESTEEQGEDLLTQIPNDIMKIVDAFDLPHDPASHQKWKAELELAIDRRQKGRGI